jgi:molecular chaperone Hsp33
VAGSVPFVDVLARFVFERVAVRGALVSLDDACREILACHAYPPPLARALAELLAAAALLASTLKFKGALVVQLQGAGPVRLLVVECSANLEFRATAQWNADAERLPPDAPLSALAGDPASSRLAITLDPKDGGPIYQGIVALAASSIRHSSSTISQRRTDRQPDGARGEWDTVRGMLSAAPDAGVEDEQTGGEQPRVDGRTRRCSMPESHFLRVFSDDDVRLFAPRATRFRCSCSEERVANTLRLLGRAEIESILAEQGLVGVTCEFCNRRYTFVAEDARALFASGRVSRPVAAGRDAALTLRPHRACRPR